MNVFAGLMPREMAPMTSEARALLAQSKALAAKIADMAQHDSTRAAVDKVLSQRRTKGAHAAMLAGLVIGALCERGANEAAERLTIALADEASDEARRR